MQIQQDGLHPARQARPQEPKGTDHGQEHRPAPQEGMQERGAGRRGRHQGLSGAARV
jgi:hypothetical protein